MSCTKRYGLVLLVIAVLSAGLVHAAFDDDDDEDLGPGPTTVNKNGFEIDERSIGKILADEALSSGGVVLDTLVSPVQRRWDHRRRSGEFPRSRRVVRGRPRGAVDEHKFRASADRDPADVVPRSDDQLRSDGPAGLLARRVPERARGERIGIRVVGGRAQPGDASGERARSAVGRDASTTGRAVPKG